MSDVNDKPNSSDDLTKAVVNLYALYDHKRKIYINPLPIEGDEMAKSLFGQLLETSSTYAYKQYSRFDLYCVGYYVLGVGLLHSDLRIIKKGTDYVIPEN